MGLVTLLALWLLAATTGLAHLLGPKPPGQLGTIQQGQAGATGEGAPSLTALVGHTGWPSAIDRWHSYIAEAARRFGIPEAWIRAVMQAESGGETLLDGRPITSPAGAMGLMQVMPETYVELSAQEGLGNDPYAPRDNILAGAAYLREMYERFGYPGLFAAYNAGPDRFSAYLSDGLPLPDETWHYLEAIGPAVTGAIALDHPSTAGSSGTPAARLANSSGAGLFFHLTATPSSISSTSPMFGIGVPDARAARKTAPSGTLFVPLGASLGEVPGASESQ